MRQNTFKQKNFKNLNISKLIVYNPIKRSTYPTSSPPGLRRGLWRVFQQASLIYSPYRVARQISPYCAANSSKKQWRNQPDYLVLLCQFFLMFIDCESNEFLKNRQVGFPLIKRIILVSYNSHYKSATFTPSSVVEYNFTISYKENSDAHAHQIEVLWMLPVYTKYLHVTQNKHQLRPGKSGNNVEFSVSFFSNF